MTVIKVKNSNVAGRIPAAGDLQPAELAINLQDKKLYSKDVSGQVFEIGVAGDVPTGGTPPSTGNNNGDLFFDTSSNELKYWSGTAWETVTVEPADGEGYVKVSGSVMSGQLGLPGGGTGSQAATVDEVNTAVTNAAYVEVSGDNMTGDLTLGTGNKITLNATDGSATFAADATINSVTVGLGGGSVAVNTAVGLDALLSNTTGNANTALGMNALVTNTIGGYNTALGYGALYENITGDANTAVGYGALYSNTEGRLNTAVGQNALNTNTTGTQNTAVGFSALKNNTEGEYNTALGVNALQVNTEGTDNTAVGRNALLNNLTGNYNTAVGQNALRNSTTGTDNTALGHAALYNTTTGKGNIGIGGTTSGGLFDPAFNITTENNRIVMGSTSVTNAYIKVNWETTSDARDKTNFAPVLHGLDFVKQLQPTAYQFKAGSRNARDPETNELIPVTAADELPSGPVRYGFKAQDILALEGDNPVIIDNDDPDHLRYRGESLVPVLVNAIQEQQVLIDDLTARLAALEGG